jgi:hypothetical protein
VRVAVLTLPSAKESFPAIPNPKPPPSKLTSWSDALKIDVFHVHDDGNLGPIVVNPGLDPGTFAVTFSPSGSPIFNIGLVRWTPNVVKFERRSRTFSYCSNPFKAVTYVS